ncbi:MAG: MBL fold metallo-hydrolase [Bacteroidota bacterium]
MVFKQFQHEEGACLSYILGCTAKRVCAVVEPQLDIEQYLEYARAKGMEITHIFETHAQADHLSGAMRLAEVTHAPVHYHESVNAAFPVRKLHDRETVSIGNIELRILHTPGHTPDSISIVVSDTTRSREPWFVLTGDTLFVGDTGRPDLDGNAEQLYESIYEKLLRLDDSLEIFPSHYAGSVCGKALSPKPSSTIGFERRFNPSLQFRSKQEFVQFVTENLPVQPPRFHKVRQFNLGFLKDPPIEKTFDIKALQITVEELKHRLDAGDRPFLLDVREPQEYEICNLNARLIPLRQLPKRLQELDPGKEIVVYCHTGSRSQQAVEFLYESGFKNVKSLFGGVEAWAQKIDPSMSRY